ncbi:MAG TPA: hypothetical protein VGC50_11100 [Gammaproteobacteria bacterium]
MSRMIENPPNQDQSTSEPEAEGAPVVRVLQRSGNEIPYPNCLVVEPYRENDTGMELLATVEHFVQLKDPTGFPWQISAVSRGPLSFEEAMNLAKAYADRKQVPIILVNHDALSSPAERQQTDTTVIKVKPLIRHP